MRPAQDRYRAAFADARRRPSSSATACLTPSTCARLRSLFFDVVATGAPPLLAAPVRRVAFPKGGLHPGETHRLADATLAGGSGLSEALAAGAEQVIVVSGVPEAPASPARRRRYARCSRDAGDSGRQAVEQDLRSRADQRMVETLGHRTEDGGRAGGTRPRASSSGLHPVRRRPARRVLGPLELDGARDPMTDVVETLEDLLERGFRDAYRAFVTPIFGGSTEPLSRRPAEPEAQTIEL
jgi:hypothetical protein